MKCKKTTEYIGSVNDEIAYYFGQNMAFDEIEIWSEIFYNFSNFCRQGSII
jgi:hypothetical protein